MLRAMLVLAAAFAALSCPDSAAPCEETPALSPRAVEALLGPADHGWWVVGDRLTVVARRQGETHLCCAMQPTLREIAPGLQAVTMRVPDIETAIFDIMVLPGPRREDRPVWRGPRAPAPPPMVERAAGRIATHRIDSRHAGRDRVFTVYVPPGLAEGERIPVVYMADGLNPEYYRLLEAAIVAGRVRPTMIVGIQPARGDSDRSCAPRCDLRSQEYLIDIPGAAPEELRFDAHARFVAEEVIPFVEANYPASRDPALRATAGHSSGGSWAVTMARRHPHLFRNAIGMSVGWTPAVEAAAGLAGTRLFLGAGLLEPGRFLEGTRRAAELARGGGAEVRLRTPNGGHAFETWTLVFADAVEWLFPAAPAER